MARRRNRKPSQGYSTPGRYPRSGPPLARAPARVLASFSPYPTLYRTRALALDHSVFAPRTVRPSLMRTVRTDTHPRWSSPSSRRSPDLPNRAIGRSMSLMRPWPTLAPEKTALPRATICAKRSIRREVLLALGRGSGSGSRGKPKSDVRCSR